MSSGTPSATTTQTRTPAAYELLASESTVQVLSPTVVNDVVYSTIVTTGHNVIASYPIPQGDFESVNSSEVLTFFARGIEEVMKDSRVVAGAGSQTIDANGLLQDTVTFTVQYVAAGTTGTTVTAAAEVPVSALRGSTSSGPGTPDVSAALAIIDAVYADLQRLAGG